MIHEVVGNGQRGGSDLTVKFEPPMHRRNRIGFGEAERLDPGGDRVFWTPDSTNRPDILPADQGRPCVVGHMRLKNQVIIPGGSNHCALQIIRRFLIDGSSRF